MFKTNPGLSGQENDDFNFNHWILDGFGLYNPNALENYTPRNIKPLRPEALPLRSLWTWRGPSCPAFLNPGHLKKFSMALISVAGCRNISWELSWWVKDVIGSPQWMLVKTVLDMAVPNVRGWGFRIPTTWRPHGERWMCISREFQSCRNFDSSDFSRFEEILNLQFQNVPEIQVKLWVSQRLQCFQRSCQGLAKACPCLGIWYWALSEALHLFFVVLEPADLWSVDIWDPWRNSFVPSLEWSECQGLAIAPEATWGNRSTLPGRMRKWSTLPGRMKYGGIWWWSIEILEILEMPKTWLSNDDDCVDWKIIVSRSWRGSTIVQWKHMETMISWFIMIYQTDTFKSWRELARKTTSASASHCFFRLQSHHRIHSRDAIGMCQPSGRMGQHQHPSLGAPEPTGSADIDWRHRLSCWPQQQLPEQRRHQTSSATKSRKMAAGSPWFAHVRHLPWSMIHYDSFFPPPNLSGFGTATTSALGKESVKVLIRPKDLYPGGHQTCQEPGMGWSKAPAATPASTARFLWKYTSKSSTIFRLIIILQLKWLFTCCNNIVSLI